MVILVCASGAGQQVPNRSRRFGPDACGPVDPSYIRMVNETGGQPMFLQPSEAAKAVHFMRESVGENHVMFLWATDTLDSSSRNFTVPIDSAVKRATFSLSTDTKGTSMTVVSPAGQNIAPGSTGVEITELNCGRIVTLTAPQPGDWRVMIRGVGTFWLQAQGKSDIFLTTLEFVRQGGRPGHEGLVRISGQPILNQPGTLQLNLSGDFETAEFQLVGQNGESITPVHMRIVSSDKDEREYVGTFDLPSKPFRVAVLGQDATGNEHQRYFNTLFHAESVEVALQQTAEDLNPGTTTTVKCKVRNVGPPTTFRVMAVDTPHFITRVEPSTLTLAAGASGTVSIDLTVPAETQTVWAWILR
jgi:hypothetical protein